MLSFAAVITAFGGASAFARAISITPNHARTMLARNSIPVRHWHRVVRAAARRKVAGVTLATLTQLATARAECVDRTVQDQTPPPSGSATPDAEAIASMRSGLVESIASHGRGATP